jgi:hypothetical protein
LATLLQPPYASRATISEDLEGLRISIPGKWTWALVFPAFWLCGWTVGGLAAAFSLFRHFSVFVSFWLVGWAVGEIVVGYIVLYAIAGREIILVRADTLACRRQIFGIGVTRSYRVAEMRNLRFQPDASSGKTRIPSRIAFDYQGKVGAFAAGLDEPEATDVINRIQQRCPIVATKPQESGIKFWEGR